MLEITRTEDLFKVPNLRRRLTLDYQSGIAVGRSTLSTKLGVVPCAAYQNFKSVVSSFSH